MEFVSLEMFLSLLLSSNEIPIEFCNISVILKLRKWSSPLYKVIEYYFDVIGKNWNSSRLTKKNVFPDDCNRLNVISITIVSYNFL